LVISKVILKSYFFVVCDECEFPETSIVLVLKSVDELFVSSVILKELDPELEFLDVVLALQMIWNELA
jgi:hypothetical protein